jgi:hypothetical protein
MVLDWAISQVLNMRRQRGLVPTYCVVVAPPPSSASSSSGGEYYPVMLLRNGVEYPVTLRRVVNDDDTPREKIFKVWKSILPTSIQPRRRNTGVFFVPK